MGKLESIFLNLLEKTHFPKVASLSAESKKTGLLRPLLAMVLILRFGQIFYGVMILGNQIEPLMLITICALSVALICFLIGFVTPITTLILAFLVIRLDALAFTITLGTAILAQLLLVLGFSGIGRNYSIDALILKKSGLGSRLLSRVYRFFTPDTPLRLTGVYALGFLSYAVVSFGALGFHLQDEYWISGQTTALFFGGAYLSHFFEFFRQLQTTLPSIYSVLTVGLIVGQSVFQFLMIPLMLQKWGKWFVIFWGWSFFISSLFLIELSYLPHVEIFFWLIIMHPLVPKKHIEVLYDDRCNLCKKSMRFLRFINYNSAIEFLALSQSKQVILEHDLDEDEVRVWMYGLVDGKVYRGFDLYIEIAKANALLWLFLPLLYIGRWTKIGYRIYAAIANNRYKYFGTCEISAPSKPTITAPEPYQYRTLRYWILIWSIVTLAYVAVRFPVSSFYVWKFATENDLRWELSTVKKVVYSFGYDLPFVFNETDLLLNERWPVLYRLKNDQLELVPYMSPEGSKMDFLGLDYLWFDNHGSDYFYFGNSLGYVRTVIDEDIEAFHGEDALGTRLMRRVIKADQFLYCSDCDTYVVNVFENHCIRKSDAPNGDPFESFIIHSDTLYQAPTKE